MDGQYVTHIHHVSQLRNMRETCAKHARNVRNALRETRETCAKHTVCAKHLETSQIRESISESREITAKHRETCAKHARNVRNALRESRETSRNMRETCAKRRVPRVTYWPSIGIPVTASPHPDRARRLAGSLPRLPPADSLGHLAPQRCASHHAHVPCAVSPGAQAMFFMPAIALVCRRWLVSERGLVRSTFSTDGTPRGPGAASGGGLTVQRDTVVRGSLHVRDERRRAL